MTTESHLPTASAIGRPGNPWVFAALACTITWTLDLPAALAFLRGEPPAPGALLLAGLGAFGPTLAVVAMGRTRGTWGEVFGRWATSPRLVLLALALPAAVHLPATLIEVALGGEPAQWFYPPVRAEHVAALIFFSVGEEFGWRGYAYPRLAERHGPVVGSLVLGAIWGAWHLLMFVTPERGMPAPTTMLVATAELALWSVIIAWLFEKSGRSMAVAIAIHAGAHLDNVHRAPEDELRLRILRFAVLAIAAAIAARALSRREHEPTAPSAETIPS
jgi:uncharacterized protein